MAACPEGEAAIIPTQTMAPILLCHRKGTERRAAHNDNIKRQRKEMRDLTALMWASRLGSQESMVLALIVLMWRHRETISTPEETRKHKKGGMDPRLQKRKE